MNDKSRNIHAACAASTLANLSNNKDYYKLVKPHLNDHFSKEIPSFPSVKDLRSLAEKEFINSYGLFPTCAVFAPGCLTMAGKNAGLAESKSLSMAIQLVTVVVGKRSHGSKWCQVKTLLDGTDGERFNLYMNDENLRVSAEETPWTRYLKGTIQCFKASRAHVPGFQIVIVSSLPMKRGLGSSSALVVALYTFLEAITNTCTGSIIEKTLICRLAEKLATNSCKVRLSDALTSLLGGEDEMLAFDPRSLDIERCNWNGIDVELILIELTNIEKNQSADRCTDETCSDEITTVMNTMSRWRTHPMGVSMMKLLFSQRTIEMVNDVINEDKRIAKMTSAVRKEQWNELGKLLWENHRSVCKYLSFLSDDIKRVESVFETVEGVLGASVINYGTSIVTLVQKSKLKTFISFLNRTKISQQYYLIKACVGASTIYKYERRLYPYSIKFPYRPKLIIKYHLHDKHNVEENHDIKPDKPENINTIPLFIPRKSSHF